MEIPYLGPAGTYTEAALSRYMPGAKRIPFSSITKVFEAVASDAYQVGFVPLRPRGEGRVADTLDALVKYNEKVSILDTSVFKIEHAIGIHSAAGMITRVLSKDTALAQCKQYLDENYHSAAREPRNSTAMAIAEVAAGVRDAAAIGMKESLLDAGLKVVGENIGDLKNNRTQFALIGHGMGIPGYQPMTSLAITPTIDRVGLLGDILDIIKSHQINIGDMETRRGRGEYTDIPTFFVDLEGHYGDPDGAIRNCLRDMGAVDWIRVKNLGSYHFDLWDPRRINTIGIIGGNGSMGKFFADFFRQNKYDVLISDKGTQLTNEELVRKSDAVMLSTPVYPRQNVTALIDLVAPLLKPGQLLFDNFGVKSDYVDRMIALTAPGVEVLTMHTMFGGKVGTVAGHTIVAVKTAKSKEAARELIHVLTKNRAQLTYTDSRTHDISVLPVQAQNHLMAAVHSTVSSKMVGQPSNLLPYLSLNARLPAVAFGRILAGNVELYVDMILANPHSGELADALSNDFAGLRTAIHAQDREFLVKYFKEAQKTLGPEYLTQSQIAGTYLLEQLGSAESPSQFFNRQKHDVKQSQTVAEPDKGHDATITFHKSH